MGRPDYDFSFFLTDDFFARQKKPNNNNKTQRGCEMNQLEMTIDESLQGKHLTTICIFQQSKSQLTSLIQCRISFLLTQEFTAGNNNSVRNKAEILLT